MCALRTTAFAAAVIVAALPAWAQSTQDQNTRAPGPGPAMQGQMGPRGAMMGSGGEGMMGGPMMGGPMMGGPTMGGQGVMPMPGMTGMMGMMVGGAGGHVEGRLAFIKTELKITEAQSAQWDAFADAVRANAKSLPEMRQSMMSGSSTPKTLPERLALAQKAMAARLDGLTKTSAALDKLYDALSPDQKKVADEIIVGPMGMPMGMM